MKALIIVDVQNDFLPGGALAVKEGDQIVSVINKLMPLFDLVVATKDFHPENHLSFASNHPDKRIGDVVDLNGTQQVLWPDHCVQGSHGAEFAPGLIGAQIQNVFHKGTNTMVDSYSGFFDNEKKLDTGLAKFLSLNEIVEVAVVGLATDYCVKYTALDARDLGFITSVIHDAVKAVNLNPQDEDLALTSLRNAGVLIRGSNEYDK